MIKWKHVLILLGILAVWQFFLKPKKTVAQTTAPETAPPAGKPYEKPKSYPPQKPPVPTKTQPVYAKTDNNFVGAPEDQSPIQGM